MTPYYDDGTCQIYHGDARSFIPDRMYECVVTSPPYNVGMNYDTHDDATSWSEYWEMANRVSFVIARYLIDGGRAWVNTAVSVPRERKKHSCAKEKCKGHHGPKERVLLAVEWANMLAGAHLNLIDQVAWTSMRGTGTAWGSYQSPSAPNLRGDWEAITVACKGDWAREGPLGWRDELGNWAKLCTTVWPITSTNSAASAIDHPAQFPIEIAARCIRLSIWPGETVFDPFMGSGSTLVAAKQLGRKALGVDVSERYCEIAAKRLAQGTMDFGDAA